MTDTNDPMERLRKALTSYCDPPAGAGDWPAVKLAEAAKAVLAMPREDVEALRQQIRAGKDTEWKLTRERDEQRARADALADQIGDARDAGEIAPDESFTAGVRDLRWRAEKAEAALGEKPPTGQEIEMVLKIGRLESAVKGLARLLTEAEGKP